MMEGSAVGGAGIHSDGKKIYELVQQDIFISVLPGTLRTTLRSSFAPH